MNEMPSYDWLPVMFAYVEIRHFRCEKSSVFPRNYSIRYLRRAPFIYLIYDNSLAVLLRFFLLYSQRGKVCKVSCRLARKFYQKLHVLGYHQFVKLQTYVSLYTVDIFGAT